MMKTVTAQPAGEETVSTIEPIDIATSYGSLSAIVHLPAHRPAPVVVCCHGLLSSKDSSKWVLIGKELCRNGLGVVRFDFSGCGASRASMGEDLVSGRVRDLRAVLGYVYAQPWWNGVTGLMGSSFGGFVALLTASQEQGSVSGVVSWASPFDLARIRLSGEDRRNLSQRFAPGLPPGASEKLEGHRPVGGVLILHGRQDEVVPWQDAHDIYEWSGEPRQLLMMELADHRITDPESRGLAVRLSVDWLMERTGVRVKK